MTERVSALKIRRNLGEILNKTSYRGDSFIIERAGKEMGALIPLEEYKIVSKLKEENFSALKNIWEKIGKDRISEKDIAEAIKKIRMR